MIRELLDVLEHLARVEIIVVPADTRGGTGLELLRRTSSIPPQQGEIPRPILSRPTLTCVTKADYILTNESFPQDGTCAAKLDHQANLKVKTKSLPFDFVSSRENLCAPRSWACFNPTKVVPEDAKSRILVADDVLQWIEAVLLGEQKK